MASRGAYGKGYQRGFDAGKTSGFKVGFDSGKKGTTSAIAAGIIGSLMTAFVGFLFGKRR